MVNEEFGKIEELYRRCETLRITKEKAKETKKIFEFGWDEDLEFSITEEMRSNIKKEVINMLEKVIQDCSEKIEAIKIPRS